MLRISAHSRVEVSTAALFSREFRVLFAAIGSTARHSPIQSRMSSLVLDLHRLAHKLNSSILPVNFYVDCSNRPTYPQPTPASSNNHLMLKHRRANSSFVNLMLYRLLLCRKVDQWSCTNMLHNSAKQRKVHRKPEGKRDR